MPKSKKFIDRKNAVTFHLVHRSQQDPLTADETAPQRVLVPVQNKDDKTRKDEQKQFGIFFDDDYNYLQHLRDTSRTVVWEKIEPVNTTSANLKLPSSVFESVVEEDVGLLNKAAPHSGPRLDLDPDVVAAMDEDFDYDDPNNELEDNFMDLANAECSEDEEYSDEEKSDVDSNFNYSDEERDEVGSLEEKMFMEEETKSRFTDYSISSSVIRRNEQLTLLDDRFEKLYSSYDENEIGALDCEEIEGFVDPNSDILLRCADEFEKGQKTEQIEKDELMARLAKLEEESSGEDDNEELVRMEVKEKEKWDCESILSTYSNIYNHPKLITEPRTNHQKIKINMRTGMPENVLGTNKLTAKALSQFNADNTPEHKSNGPKSECAKSVISALSTLSLRPKDETPEQRKDRKKHLKEYRKTRREEKKLNAQAFKEETKRQVKIAINNKNNIQGNRIL